MTAPAQAPTSPASAPPPSIWRLMVDELRSLPQDQRWATTNRFRSLLPAALIAYTLLMVAVGVNSRNWALLLLRLAALPIMATGVIDEARRLHIQRNAADSRGARWLLSMPLFAAAALVGSAMAFGMWLAAPFRTPHVAELSVGILATVIMILGFREVSRGCRRLYDTATTEASAAALAESAATTSRLMALQSQMNPHFLFNALNTVAALIRHEPKAAERTVENLADVLRRTLARSERTTTTVAEELAYVRAYLEIEEQRWKERLTVHWEIADGVGDHAIPPFVLQPLVENALKHGLSERLDGMTITIAVSEHQGRLRLSVADDGIGFPRRHVEKVGLGNLRTRIALYAPESGSLEVATVDRGAMVVVDLPAQTAVSK